MFEPSEADTFASMLERLIAENSLTDEALPTCLLYMGVKDTVSDVAVQLSFSVVQCCQLNEDLFSMCSILNKQAAFPLSMDFLL